MIFEKLLKLNFLLLFIIIIIAIIGFFSLYSAAGGNYEPWAKKQIIRFIFSFILLFFIALFDIKFFYKYAYIFFLFCLFLLISVEIAGTFGFGAKRWIYIYGFSIQPSELIKVSIILALARYYHDLKFYNIKKVRYIFVPLFIIFIPFFFVLKQPDLGTSLIIILLGLSIMFISGIRIWKFFLGFIITIISFPFVWSNLKIYQQKRILTFLNPDSDPLGAGYQLSQSKIALGSGGSTGKGYLQGTQSYLEYLPEKQTDFIFTLIGEEFGFIGTIFLLLLFFLIIIISYYIAYKSNYRFGKLLALGISINLFLYIFPNIAMVTGLLPVVGIPLPLISYGGTAMLSVMISFGFLMNVNINNSLKNFN